MMDVSCPIRSQRGFTLLEVMIAAAMTGALLLMAAAGMTIFSAGSVQLSKQATRNSDMALFASKFSSLMETASVAMQYEHLPIKNSTTCNVNSPAVRRLSGLDFVCPDAAINGITDYSGTAAGQVEFFRDSSGVIAGNGKVLIGGSPPAGSVSKALITSPALSIPANVQSGDYYATWPLIDDTSEPFVVLRAAEAGISLNYLYCSPGIPAANYECGALAALPPGSTVERFSSQTPLTSAQLLGSLMLIYNSKDPVQYMIRQVAAANKVSAALPEIWDLDLVTVAGSTAFDSGTYGNYTNATNQVSLFNLGTVPSSWNTAWNPQPATFYLFATSWPSADVANGVAGTPLRKMAEFFDSQNPPSLPTLPSTRDLHPRIVAFPIHITAFKLWPGNVPKGCPANTGSCPAQVPAGCPANCKAYRLTAQTLVGDTTGADQSQPITMMDGLFPLGSAPFAYPYVIVFARKLGTESISVFTTND